MRRAGVAAVAALLATMAACVSLTGLDKGEEGKPADDAGIEGGIGTDSGPSADGAASDATVIDDSSSDATSGNDAGAQLVVNGTFETGSCAPFMYNASKATIGASTNARTGASACMVCNSGGAMQTVGIWQDFAQGTLGPGKYTFDAYVKTEGDAGNALAQAQVTVKTMTGASRYPTYQTNTTTTGFAPLHLVIDVAADEFLAGFLIGLYSDTTGPCVVFDDVSLVKD